VNTLELKLTLKKHLIEIGITITVDMGARIHCYKTATTLNNKFNAGKIEEVEKLALEAEERINSVTNREFRDTI